MKIKFDPTISIGSILGIMATIGALFTFFSGMKNDIEVLKSQVADVRLYLHITESAFNKPRIIKSKLTGVPYGY